MSVWREEVCVCERKGGECEGRRREGEYVEEEVCV